MPSDLAVAWHKNQEANRLLLDALAEEHLHARYSPTTRTVAAQFAHLHNIRVSQIEHRSAENLGDLTAFPRGAQPTRHELVEALEASAAAIGKLLSASEEAGDVKSWGGPPSTLLGYLISHESHHRGLALVALRLSGVRLPKSVLYGIWGLWRKRG